MRRESQRHAPALASRFRDDLFDCLTARGDELFELADALLCADGPVRVRRAEPRERGRTPAAAGAGGACPCRRPPTAAWSSPSMSATGPARTRRPTRSVCSAMSTGTAAGLRTSSCPAGRTRSSPRWSRAGRPGDSSWTPCVSGPDDEAAEVTAAQVRRVVVDLVEMRRWHVGDRDILVVFDAGYDAPRMAHLLDGLPVEEVGRVRSDRVMRRPTADALAQGVRHRGRRPLDVADHRRPHPAPAHPRSRRGPPPPLGKAGRVRTAHPGPRPPRVSEPPPTPALPGPLTETLNTRTRKATWIEEPPPHDPP